MTGGIRLFALLAFSVVSALAVYASSHDAAAIPTFGPGGVICFEKYDASDYSSDLAVKEPAECDGDPSPGAASDTRVKFCVGWNDDCTAQDSPVTDSNFGGAVGFIPAPAVIKPGSEIPVGALAGALDSDPVLGVLGQPCLLAIPQVNFTFMNASLNTADTIAPKPIGQKDVMLPLAQDKNGNGIPDGADKYPAYLNALFDVDHNYGPDFIPNTSLDANGQPASSDDVNGPTEPLKPIVRLYGNTRIQGNWIVLNILVFPPGSTVRGPDRAPLPLNPDFGYPTAIALQDSTVPLAPGAISDFCAPLRVRFVTFGLTHDNPCTGGQDTAANESNCPSEMNAVGEGPVQNAGNPFAPCENINSVDEDGDGSINDGCPQVNAVAESGAQCSDDASGEGGGEDSNVNDGCPAVGEGENVYIGSGCSAGANEGGCEARKNSAQAGTIPVPIGTRSLNDADDDGIENLLDVCALKANPEWNPRTLDIANDPDNDGLPSVCDPNPNQISGNSPGGCEAGTVGPDEDQDCYSNRQDNCPLASGLKNPSAPAHPTNNPPQLFDTDGDGIGDLCDITSCDQAVAAAYKAADCALFGTSAKGTAADGVGSQDGGYAVDCVTFQITVGAGAPTRATGPVHNTDPNCLNAFGTTTTGGDGGTGGTGGGGTGTGGTGGGTCIGANCVDTGIGTLSPVAGTVPAWAAVLGGFGVAGLIGSLGVLGSRLVRRRD